MPPSSDPTTTSKASSRSQPEPGERHLSGQPGAAPTAFCLAQTSYPSESRGNTCSHSCRTESAHRPRRRFAPELLEAVVLARLGREDVDHAVPIVEQDPASLAAPLGAARQDTVRGVL